VLRRFALRQCRNLLQTDFSGDTPSGIGVTVEVGVDLGVALGVAVGVGVTYGHDSLPIVMNVPGEF
jgi:hypothetical protein